jgi:hypothetical protein
LGKEENLKKTATEAWKDRISAGRKFNCVPRMEQFVQLTQGTLQTWEQVKQSSWHYQRQGVALPKCFAGRYTLPITLISADTQNPLQEATSQLKERCTAVSAMVVDFLKGDKLSVSDCTEIN